MLGGDDVDPQERLLTCWNVQGSSTCKAERLELVEHVEGSLASHPGREFEALCCYILLSSP